MKWIGLLMALIVASIGTVLFIAGCVWGYQRAALYLDGAAAQGQVVGNLEIRGRDGYSYRPMVEFLVGGEAKHRLIDDISWDEPPYEIGSTVKVLYDPKYPEAAVIARFRTLFLGPLFVGLIGLLFLALSIGLFFHSRSSDKTFYPKSNRKMDKAAREQDRFALPEGKKGILLMGVVDSVRQQHGASREEYVVICRATLPGAIRPEHFEAAPISFHPGRRILGKSVEIYVHRGDNARDAVMLEPVLAELQSAKR